MPRRRRWIRVRVSVQIGKREYGSKSIGFQLARERTVEVRDRQTNPLAWMLFDCIVGNPTLAERYLNRLLEEAHQRRGERSSRREYINRSNDRD